MADLRQNLIRRFAERPPELEGGLRVSVDPVDDGRAMLRIAGDGHQISARAAALTVAFPSGLRRLLTSDPEVEVVLVERGSQSLDRAAQEESVGYLDLSGHGRLVAPGFVYVVAAAPRRITGDDLEDESHQMPRGAVSPRVSPFAPKASRVVRAVLSDPRRAWRVSEVADVCRMNPGTAHRVLRSLSERGFLEPDSAGYFVAEPGALLEAWAENARPAAAATRLTIPVRGGLADAVKELVEKLDGSAAVSGELAAELYAPHLPATSATIHCLDQRLWDPERLGAHPGPPVLRAQGRVFLDLADPGVADFGRVDAGFSLVSPQQLYVDLYRLRSRAREAAEHVRAELLGY